MNILEALKGEASKLQQQLDTLNSAIKALGGNSAGLGCRSQEMAYVGERKSQNGESAKKALAENQSEKR